MLAALPEAVSFLGNFFPTAAGRPPLLVAGLTGLFWLLALPFGWFPGGDRPAADNWRAAAGQFLRVLTLAMAGLALGLAVAVRAEPFPHDWATGENGTGVGKILTAQLFSAWATARRAPRAYAPIFGVLTFLLPFGGWLLEQFAAMLACPAPTFASSLGRGSYFSCLAAMTRPAGEQFAGGSTAVFIILQLMLGAGILLICRPRHQA